MQFYRIQNLTQPIHPIRAQKCGGFFCRFRGLMLRPSLKPDEGLFMIQPASSRAESSIHMLFMRFDLAVVWLDEAYRAVDVQLCKRWWPAYFPARPAKYVIELHVSRMNDFAPGDQVSVEPC